MADLLIDHASGVRCDYLRHRSALHGLEARPPLLDVDLALFALRIPPHLGLDPDRDRPLARDAMRGILPEPVRTRTVKSDLSAFYRAITTGGDVEDVRRLLLDPGCEVYGYADRETIMRLAERPPDDGRLAGQMQIDALHACATVECWLRRQADPGSTESIAEQVNSPSYREIVAPIPAPMRALS
jgi:asparagine synthase (glutamine-hydrolysing)